MSGGADEPGSTVHDAPGACFQVRSTLGNGTTHCTCIDAALAAVSCVWLDQFVAAMFPLTYAQLAPALDVGVAADAVCVEIAPDNEETARPDIIAIISVFCRINIVVALTNHALISVPPPDYCQYLRMGVPIRALRPQE